MSRGPGPASTGNGTDAKFYLGLMRAYFDSANDGIFVLCDEQKFLVANRTMAEWIGESEERLTEHNRRVPITEFLGSESCSRIFVDRFMEAIAGSPVRFECHIHPPRGQPRWVEICMNRVNIDSGNMVIAVVRDVTQQKLVKRRFEHQVLHDELTGLLNRRGFMNHLERLVQSAARRDSRHALLCLDLDQFKLINDTCGHSAGDDLLQQAAMLLRCAVPTSATVCRLGGDEFAILLANCSAAEPARVAQDILRSFSVFRFSWQQRVFDLAASIGVAEISENSRDSLSVLMQADAACYAAKESGRNRVMHYTRGAKFTHLHSEMDWASTITESLHRDRFRLYFQRIVPAAGANPGPEHHEILLRMIDARGQIVAPGKFLGAAVKYNLMADIDRWVIRHVFETQSHHWQVSAKRAGITAINLSGASLNDESFYDFLKEQIRLNDVPPHAVCFEITESVAVHDLQHVAAFMADFRKMGFHFALDDFGSGVSSFSYLKALPVDFIKIDGNLVRDVAHSPVDRRIIEAIVYVAREMNIATVAEYVEDWETHECLAAIGVDFSQGYASHHPEPLDNLLIPGIAGKQAL